MTDATKPHPDLPECPGCGATRWRADLVSFWPCYYGWREWHRIEMGQTVDVAPLFAERVAKLRAAEEARAS